MLINDDRLNDHKRDHNDPHKNAHNDDHNNDNNYDPPALAENKKYIYIYMYCIYKISTCILYHI